MGVSPCTKYAWPDRTCSGKVLCFGGLRLQLQHRCCICGNHLVIRLSQSNNVHNRAGTQVGQLQDVVETVFERLVASSQFLQVCCYAVERVAECLAANGSTGHASTNHMLRLGVWPMITLSHPDKMSALVDPHGAGGICLSAAARSSAGCAAADLPSAARG